MPRYAAPYLRTTPRFTYPAPVSGTHNRPLRTRPGHVHGHFRVDSECARCGRYGAGRALGRALGRVLGGGGRLARGLVRWLSSLVPVISARVVTRQLNTSASETRGGSTQNEHERE